MFWFVAGIGLLERREFRVFVGGLEQVGRGVIVVPPHWESDLPLGSVPNLSPEVEAAGLECLAEALVRRLRAAGKLRALEAKARKAEALLDSTRKLLREIRPSA